MDIKEYNEDYKDKEKFQSLDTDQFHIDSPTFKLAMNAPKTIVVNQEENPVMRLVIHRKAKKVSIGI